jgi:hypothetical protein
MADDISQLVEVVRRRYALAHDANDLDNAISGSKGSVGALNASKHQISGY